jgi:hypothetical protein
MLSASSPGPHSQPLARAWAELCANDDDDSLVISLSDSSQAFKKLNLKFQWTPRPDRDLVVASYRLFVWGPRTAVLSDGSSHLRRWEEYPAVAESPGGARGSRCASSASCPCNGHCEGADTSRWGIGPQCRSVRLVDASIGGALLRPM